MLRKSSIRPARDFTGFHGKPRETTGNHGQPWETTTDPHGISRGITGTHGNTRERTGKHGKTRENNGKHGKTRKELNWETRPAWLRQGKTNEGVRAYQSARVVQHVLEHHLETNVTDFAPPKGLSRMSSGDRRIWDEEEGRWYQGAPPIPGSCHRTSMEPELPNIGKVPRFLPLTMDQKQTQWHMAHFLASFDNFSLVGTCSTGHGTTSSGQ